jgi:hypothetical protein
MEKISSKRLRKLIFSFTPKNCKKYPFLGRLKRPHLENHLSVRAEILCGILRIIVLGLDGKNSFKNAWKIDFQFMKKNLAKIPLFGRLKQP